MVELTIYQYTYETLIGLVLLLAGVPIYLMILKQRSRQNKSRLMSKYHLKPKK